MASPDLFTVAAEGEVSFAAVKDTGEPAIMADVDGELSFDLRLADGRRVLVALAERVRGHDAKVVGRIAQLCDTSSPYRPMSWRAIADTLRIEGYLNPGKRGGWTGSAVQRIAQRKDISGIRPRVCERLERRLTAVWAHHAPGHCTQSRRGRGRCGAAVVGEVGHHCGGARKDLGPEGRQRVRRRHRGLGARSAPEPRKSGAQDRPAQCRHQPVPTSASADIGRQARVCRLPPVGMLPRVLAFDEVRNAVSLEAFGCPMPTLGWSREADMRAACRTLQRLWRTRTTGAEPKAAELPSLSVRALNRRMNEPPECATA